MADTALVIDLPFIVVSTSRSTAMLSPALRQPDAVVVETRQCPSCHSEINEFDCDILKVSGRTKFYCPVCEVEMCEVRE